MKTKGLSQYEALILKNLLAKAKFPLPSAAFDGWVENLPTVALELAIVRQSKGGWGWEIFLANRGPKDKFWPNEWHMPGRTIRQNELLQESYRRLLQSEMFSNGRDFGDLRFIGKCELSKGDGNRHCRRGHEIALLHVVEFHGKILKKGKFFPIAKLPAYTVPHHHTLVTMVKKFLGV